MDGIPVGLKDMIDISDMATVAGSASLQDNYPSRDAEVVRRLRGAGAIVVAKLATSPFAFAEPFAAEYPVTRNPWDADRFAGGTSMGAGAAVAARMLPLAIGTDSAGSVRIPAAHCGISGMKPTAGAVSRRGVLPSTWSLDTVGVMGRSALDMSIAFSVIAGADVGDAAAFGHVRIAQPAMLEDLRGVRVGVLGGEFLKHCSPAAMDVWTRTIDNVRGAGAELVDLTIPMADLVNDIAWPLLAVELASCHEGLSDRDVRYGDMLGGLIAFGKSVPAIDYVRCQRLRVVFQQRIRESFATVDIGIGPTVQAVAPTVSDLFTVTANGRTHWYEVAAKNTLPFSLAGFPALSIPAGIADDGLPFGVQIVGADGKDTQVLQVGMFLQHMSTHHQRDPYTRPGSR